MDWEKIKLVSWGVVGGSLVTMYVGFNAAGWMTDGAARIMAKEISATAVAERLGTDLRGAVQPGHRKETEADRHERQRQLGQEPLYRYSQLGNHAW